MEGGATSVVMDEWVRPAHAVTDHLTAVSGVTAERLDGATHTLATVQDALLTAVGVRDVLVGHSLATDLKVRRVSSLPPRTHAHTHTRLPAGARAAIVHLLA
jgi:DNA polymerase III epsilon subunit-like protein